jgi:hypothetical protein
MSAEQENRFKEIQAKNQKATEGALKVNAQIEHARETITKLQDAAEKKFGERDLDKIKEKLQFWKQENDNINNRSAESVEKVNNEVILKQNLIREAQLKYQKN